MRRLNSSRFNSKASAAYWLVRVIQGGVRTLRWSAVVAMMSTLLVAQREGEQQWRFSVGGYITLSSPALSPDGTTVYVGVDTGTGGRMIAASTRDGAARWNRVFTEFFESSPTVAADGTIYIGGGDGLLYALEPGNGSIRWGRSLGGFVSSSPALAGDGTLYVGAGDGGLHAITSGGDRLWTFQTDDVIFSSPAIGTDGTIYFGSFDRNLYAVTPAGQKKWEFATNGPIFSSPAIGADGTIYFGSGDQRVYAVTPEGARKWDYFTDGPVDASPTLGADGTIYVASDRNLYALRPEDDGERLRWKRDLGSGSISSAAIRGDGAIVLGADNGIVRALNPADGSERWRFDTRSGPDNLIESSPIVATDGSIYIGSYDGALYKINGNGSPLSAYSAWPAFRRDTRHTGRARPTNTGGRLVNISTRAQAGEAGGDRNLIVGFVAQATPGQGRAYLIRAVGPGLQARNVAGFVPDPRLQLFAGESSFQVNDNWLPNDEFFGFSLPDTAAAVQAFPLEPGSADAAILPALPGGVFTAHVTSSDTRSGVALVEVYDGLAGDSTARILNLSTRGFVGTDENILIAGFVVGGTGSMRLLLRAIGPGLTQFRVPGAIAQPRLTLFSGDTIIASNTGWTSAGFQNDLFVAGASVSAFPLAPTSADSAVLFDAAPGAYTIQISGVGAATGEAMVEIYVLP